MGFIFHIYVLLKKAQQRKKIKKIVAFQLWRNDGWEREMVGWQMMTGCERVDLHSFWKLRVNESCSSIGWNKVWIKLQDSWAFKMTHSMTHRSVLAFLSSTVWSTSFPPSAPFTVFKRLTCMNFINRISFLLAFHYFWPMESPEE